MAVREHVDYICTGRRSTGRENRSQHLTQQADPRRQEVEEGVLGGWGKHLLVDMHLGRRGNDESGLNCWGDGL